MAWQAGAGRCTPCGAAVDVWAAGAVCFELLLGRRPPQPLPPPSAPPAPSHVQAEAAAALEPALPALGLSVPTPAGAHPSEQTSTTRAGDDSAAAQSSSRQSWVGWLRWVMTPGARPW
jgi:serine/threonine protein kinase